MSASRLHLGCWKVPDAAFQVELVPFGMTELARPHEHVWRDAQGGFDNWAT